MQDDLIVRNNRATAYLKKKAWEKKVRRENKKTKIYAYSFLFFVFLYVVIGLWLIIF